MEIPPNPYKDIHPAWLLDKYEGDLRNRLGDHNYESRLAIEQHVNPARSTTFGRFIHVLVHRWARLMIQFCLSLLGKRRQAMENCWKTETFLNTFSLKNYRRPKPLRILHLSDFHLNTNLQQASGWAALIRELDYDIAVITGDYFNGYALPNSIELAALQTVIQSIRKPIYGILGNHDCMLITPYLEEMGVTVLLNESLEVDTNGLKLLITGLDDPHFFQTDDLAFATRDLKPDPARYDLSLILCHSPKPVKSFAKAGYDLCLSGHTHGGQLCTRSGIPILRNGLYLPDTVAGKWKIQNLNGYTSRGTGTGRLAFRLNCLPEIVLHEIRQKSSE